MLHQITCSYYEYKSANNKYVLSSSIKNNPKKKTLKVEINLIYINYKYNTN